MQQWFPFGGQRQRKGRGKGQGYGPYAQPLAPFPQPYPQPMQQAPPQQGVMPTSTAGMFTNWAHNLADEALGQQIVTTVGSAFAKAGLGHSGKFGNANSNSNRPRSKR